MVPALLGEKAAGRAQNNHEYLYWEFHERGTSQAVRFGDWKAIRKKPGEAIELYDLARDEAEQNNVAGQHAEQVQQAESILAKARTVSKHWPIDSQTATP